jgi:phosphonate transport system substrate-binding protein
VIALAPAADAVRARSLGDALVAALERASGLRWRLALPSSFADAIDDLCAATVDIALLDQLAHLLASERNCADAQLALQRTDETGRASVTFRRQILVLAESPITGLAGLRGRAFAFGEGPSAPGTLETLRVLTSPTGGDPLVFFSRTLYLAGQGEAALALLRGEVDGAAVHLDVRDSAGRAIPDLGRRTRRLATTPDIPTEPIVVRRGIPPQLADDVGRALIDAATSDAGRRALRELYAADGLGRIDPNAYESLRAAARAVRLDLKAEAAKTPRPAAR